jgi:hypothetical protein
MDYGQEVCGTNYDAILRHPWQRLSRAIFHVAFSSVVPYLGEKMAEN